MNYSTDNGYSKGLPAIFAQGDYDTTVTLSAMRHYGGGGYVAVDVKPDYGNAVHTVINFDALAEFVDAVRESTRRVKIETVQAKLDAARAAANDAMHRVDEAEVDVSAAENAYQYALADYHEKLYALADYHEKLDVAGDLDRELDDLLYGDGRY